MGMDGGDDDGLDDRIEKHRTHINMFEYQHEYLDEHGYNISKVVRRSIDDWILQDGGDPEQLRRAHVEEDVVEDAGADAGG